MEQALYRLTMLIAGMAVITTLFEALIPQGRLRNTVLFAVGLVFLLAVAEPLLGLFSAEPLSLPASAPIEAAPAETPTHEELLRGYYEQAEKAG